MPLVSFYNLWRKKQKKQKRFSDVSKGYRNRLVVWNGLSCKFTTIKWLKHILLCDKYKTQASTSVRAMKKNITRIYSKNNKTDLSKTREAIRYFVKVVRKSKRTPWSLKHKGVLLFNPVKIAETFNFFFTNIGTNIAKRIPKGKKSPMTYLNDKI